MNDTPYTREDDDATELKSLIRRVRSLAGARRFGQSIGSIIKIDASPDAASRRKAKKPDLSKPRVSITPDTAIVDARNSLELWEPTEDDPFPIFHTADVGLKPVTNPRIPIEKYNRTTLDLPEGVTMVDYRHPDSQIRIVLRPVPGEGKVAIEMYDAELERRLGNGVAAHPFYKSLEGENDFQLDDWFLSRAHMRLDDIRENVTVVRAVAEDRFNEDGYSLPWLRYDEETGQTVSDLSDVERIQRSYHHLREMGVELSLEEAAEFTPVAIETVAMSHASMMKHFPDWNAYLSRYHVVPDHKNPAVLAWNQGIFEHDDSESLTSIGLCRSYFGHASRQNLVDIVQASIGSGHFSANSLSDVMENTGLGKDHAAHLLVITHETGHTIGQALHGLLVNSQAMNERRARTGAERMNLGYVLSAQRTQMEYTDEVASETQFLFARYGLTDQEIGSDDLTATEFMDSWRSEDKWPPLIRPNLAMQSHLSRYGTSALHEMMAEAWAAYVLSDSPTQFAYEYGNFMYTSFRDMTNEPDITSLIRN